MGKLMKNGVSYSGWSGPSGGGENPLPSGGTTGQVLSKASNADYDVEWTTPSGGGGGGGSEKVIWQSDAQGYMRYPRIEYQPLQNSTQESGHVYYDVREYDKSYQVQKHIEINYDYVIATGIIGGPTECKIMPDMERSLLTGLKHDGSKVTFSNNWVALYPGESGSILSPSFYLKSITWDGTSDAEVTFGISFTLDDNGYYTFEIENQKTIPAANMSYAAIQYETLQTEEQ